MRRLMALVGVLVMLPATVASAAELDELLERGREASYSAEQVISCSTPDGVRDALVTIAQEAGEMRVSSTITADVQISSGYGGWTLSRQGGVVSSASVESSEEPVEPLYVVEPGKAAVVLGRSATIHRLVRDGLPRAELTVDNKTGALVAVVTFAADGSTYCERRFVSFDPTAPGFEPTTAEPAQEPGPNDIVATSLPETVAGFDRLDLYEDAEGIRFAYFSDGFFSFAVFETPTAVALPEGLDAVVGETVYRRSFTAGQATYVWETPDGGMALVGDLPPDLHGAVLAELPPPESPGLLRRLWRTLFG